MSLPPLKDGERWLEAPADPGGFGEEFALLLRDCPDQGVVLTLTKQGLNVWDREQRRRLRQLAPEGWDPFYIDSSHSALTADGALLYLREGTLHRLSSSERQTKIILEHEDDREERPNWLKLSADNDTVALAHKSAMAEGFAVFSLGGQIELWRSTDEVNGLSFSPHGTLLMAELEICWQSGSATAQFTVYEARSGEVVTGGGGSCYNESLYWSKSGRKVELVEWGEEPRQTWQACRIRRKPPPYPQRWSWDALLAELDA